MSRSRDKDNIGPHMRLQESTERGAAFFNLNV